MLISDLITRKMDKQLLKLLHLQDYMEEIGQYLQSAELKYSRPYYKEILDCYLFRKSGLICHLIIVFMSGHLKGYSVIFN